MDLFSPSEYFDLSAFEHASIFDNEGAVWQALQRIGQYLASHSLGNLEALIEPGAHLIHPKEISIGKGSVVEAGAYIRGPCLIGENCEIRHGAYIRGDVIVGNNCVIGHSTEVKHSIFLDGAQVGHLSYVGDSILGNRVNLGAGTKCANLRFDHQPIMIHWKNRHISTEMRKLGAILGDDAQTGCNSVTNPGTLMGKGYCLAPCTTAYGVIPAKYVKVSS